MKLEVELEPATDTRYEHIIFRQEGMIGLRLPGCWLSEFVKCLEMSSESGRICVYQNLWLETDKTKTLVSKSAIDTPLLSLTHSVRAKLIAHLKQAYASLL